MSSTVELRAVTKRFGASTAVDGVNLEVRAGEFLTLLGPSGCGKTTLLRMISGFETPTEGQVFLGGDDVTALPPYKRNVNQVFQSYALFPHLSVGENIGFGLRMKKVPAAEAAERVARVVELVSLQGFEKRSPGQLSGGQRQRVALARALVCEPRVLLLDEPLSALDAKLRHQMQLELKELQHRLGMTFIFVTHDQEEALTMSDRIAVVNKGRIEQLGDVHSIYHRPLTTFVANFIGQANILPATVAGHSSGLTTMRTTGGLQLQVSWSDPVPPDAAVLLSIRPEKLHLCKTRPPGDSNILEVVIHGEIFCGATDQLALRTPAGLELTAITANESAHAISHAKGEKLYCRVHPDDITVIVEPGSAGGR